MTRLALAIATAGGAGYFPIAPGTVGSAVGIVVFLLTRHWPLEAQAALLAAIALVGSWAGTVAASHFGRKDPGHVVIDEVAGQLLTLFAIGPTWPGIILGFFIFRALDIVKPWPARDFERLPGGWGIMADDLMAAVYGNLALRLAQAASSGMF
jgi:phosphatidylglycerophosphatase A